MDTDILKKSLLFKEMNDKEIMAALKELQTEERAYEKNTVILRSGDSTERMGMVLEGSVTIETSDMWGSRIILSHVGKGHFFAETYAWLGNEPMLVDVCANENCRILFLNLTPLKYKSFQQDSWQQILILNLLSISIRKNLALSTRSFHTAPKTIKGRVMAYLNTVSLQKGSLSFDIPFDRQQLADYLNIDRTALSKELGKMQKAGELQYRRNHFILPYPNKER